MQIATRRDDKTRLLSETLAFADARLRHDQEQESRREERALVSTVFVQPQLL